MTKKLYKIQRPLASNHPSPLALIYHRGGEPGEVFMEWVAPFFDPGELKVYVWATHNPDGTLTIHSKELAPQDW